jgi:hypothetical protein
LTCAIQIPSNFGIIRNVCVAGTDPVIVAVAGKTMCIDFDKPCTNGAIDPFEQVTLVFAGGNAGQTIKVNYPATVNQAGTPVAAGVATVTLDANGNGSFPWNVGGAGAFTLCVEPVPGPLSQNVTFPALEYTACVKECLPSNEYIVGGTVTSSETNIAC